MAILFFANKADDVQTCLDGMKSEDHLVLLGDGVNAVAASPRHISTVNLSAIHSDLQARGLVDRVPAEISIIDYPRMVELCSLYTTIVTWS